MAAELVYFPPTWDSIVASRKNNEAIYLAPTEANLLRLARPKMIELAYKDYKKLQLNRERWLTVRIEAEVRLIAISNDLTIYDIADFGPDVNLFKLFRNLGIASDIQTILLPLSLSQGFLTNTYTDSVGWMLYRDLKKYDTALLISMEACFKKTTVPESVEYIENEYDPSATLKDNIHTKMLSHRLLSADDNEDEYRFKDIHADFPNKPYYPIQQINAIPAADGRSVVRAILEELCPNNLSANVRKVIRATVYAWVIEMMRLPETDRAQFIVERTRIGLLSNFYIDGTLYESLFPHDNEPAFEKWIQLGNAIPGDPTPESFSLVKTLVNGILDKASHKTSVDPSIILESDYKLRAESVFYTNSTIPLFIACATCILYLHKQDTNGVLAGTEFVCGDLDTAAPPQTMSAREAGMVSLTTYTIHNLNMSMSELRKDDGNFPPTWSPHATETLLGKTWRETATKLIKAWGESRAESADKWIRGLKAAMLVIDGNLPAAQTD